MSVGRAFHRRGAAELEARSKTSTRYEQFRICRRAQIRLTLKCEDWLQHVGDVCCQNAGAVIFNDWYASTHILNSIREARNAM